MPTKGGSVSGSLLFILVSGEADPAVQCTTLLTAAGHSQTPLVTVFVVVVWGGSGGRHMCYFKIRMSMLSIHSSK